MVDALARAANQRGRSGRTGFWRRDEWRDGGREKREGGGEGRRGPIDMSVLRLLSCASRQARGSHAQTRAYTRKDVRLTLTRMHRMREREREEAKNTGTECVFIRTLDPKYTNKERCRKGKGVRRGGKEGIKEEGLGRLREEEELTHRQKQLARVCSRKQKKAGDTSRRRSKISSLLP